MTLHQMSTVKRWHLTHRGGTSVEYRAWDLVLMMWLMGWVGLPAAAVLSPVTGMGICLLLSLTPSSYVALRKGLHRRGLLRCDWLCAVAPPRG